MAQSTPEHDLEYLQNYGTDEEIQGYIEAKRAKAREEYTEMNQRFIDNNLPAGAEVTFVSEYSPLILAEMNASDVTKAARSSKVETAEFLDKTVKNEPSSTTYNDTTRAAYTRDNYGLKGSGVKIGIFETYGIADPDNDQIKALGLRYYHRPGYTNVSPHATMVTVIAAGPKVGSYQGVAPYATVYATYCSYSDQNADNIEWLIDMGVNVINASRTLGGTTTPPQYDAFSKYIDHISTSHDIHFVKSAGNAGRNTMSGGAMAYNAISVGATNENGNSDISNDTMRPTSSYSTYTNLINKPDLSAPGSDIQTSAGEDSGTSFATPQVTGVIAQICGSIPALKTQQTSVKALLIAGVNNAKSSSGTRKLFNSEDSLSQYQQWGAGILDANGVRFTATNSRYSRSTFYPSDANGTTKTYTFKATSSDSFIRVALCFMKKNIPNYDHTGIEKVASEANVDLTVTGPGFSKTSDSDHNNTEIVDIPNPVAGGTYTIKVKLTTKSNENVPFGVAWR